MIILVSKKGKRKPPSLVGLAAMRIFIGPLPITENPLS